MSKRHQFTEADYARTLYYKDNEGCLVYGGC